MTLNIGDKTSGDVNQKMKEKNTKCHSVQCDPRTGTSSRYCGLALYFFIEFSQKLPESYSELCQWTKEALVQWAAHCETVRQFNSVSVSLTKPEDR